jgi:hypothetical protein
MQNGESKTRNHLSKFNWGSTHYGTKQVQPVFVEEPGQIVVVTVYVYYF